MGNGDFETYEILDPQRLDMRTEELQIAPDQSKLEIVGSDRTLFDERRDRPQERKGILPPGIKDPRVGQNESFGRRDLGRIISGVEPIRDDGRWFTEPIPEYVG